MSDLPEREEKDAREELCGEVGAKEARKARARSERKHGVWFGLGMFGLVGWSVAIPTLIALALGIWIDRTFASRFSWTLMLLFLGMGLGCLNAWYWIVRERREIERRGEEPDE